MSTIQMEKWARLECNLDREIQSLHTKIIHTNREIVKKERTKT